jgi:hypothetical protein
MWNLRSLKMSVMLVASGVALVVALPAKAQQVILTPAGTMFQPTMMPGTEMGGGQPAPAPIALDPSLPSYDILTPEQLKPGKIIFRGNPVEILAPDDPRISEQMRSGRSADAVWVFGEIMAPGYAEVYYQPRHFFLAPPTTGISPTWDGNLRVGTRIPGFWGGEDVIVASDDPRIPENLRAMDLGDLYYWAIDSRSLNPALPTDLFSPLLYTRNHGFMIPGKTAADVRPEAVRAGIEQYQRELAWRNPPPGDSSEIVIVPPVDRRDEIPWMPTIRDDDNPQPSVGSLIPLKAVAQDSYDRDGRLIQTKEQAAAEIRREAEIQALYPGRLGVFDGSATVQSVTPASATMSTLAPVAVTLPAIPSVTVQASQNPTADFATTRSAPRNTVPDQLNQGIIDSPLSNSRIFPGMR